MFGRRSDLPLKSDVTSRFLPWLVAAMVFLASVAIAGALALTIITEGWHREVSGTITVQVMPPTDVSGEAARTETDKRVDTALSLLRTTPGVATARPLDHERTVALLEPWLGSREVFQDLPLPRLIDVTLEPGREVNIAGLSERLAEAVPGSSLDDHQAWLAKLVRFAYALEALAAAVVALVGATTAATVVYATRTNLAIHTSVVEVLHMIGAQDDYIARQFAARATAIGFKGGMYGVALAVPAIFGIGWMATRMEGGLVPTVTLDPAHWGALAVLPVASAILARVTARVTVRRALRRMV